MERKADDSEPFASLAFKIMTDPHVGRLTYFRVYSGKLDKGDQVLNTRTSNKERVGRCSSVSGPEISGRGSPASRRRSG